jgi:hypothetical protein
MCDITCVHLTERFILVSILGPETGSLDSLSWISSGSPDHDRYPLHSYKFYAHNQLYITYPADKQSLMNRKSESTLLSRNVHENTVIM